MWACCDVDTSYCFNLEVYTGKRGDAPEVGQAMRVVLQMTEPLANSGRGVSGDNFFSSHLLANALLARQLTYCGTVRKNKNFLPPVLTDNHQREVLSSRFAFLQSTTLVSYIPKKGKNVVLQSTQHHNADVHVEREDRKPEIILHYNRTKDAVDTMDKLIRTYSVQQKSRRWPMILFQNFVDIAAYNAFVVYLTINSAYNQGKTLRRRLFLEELGVTLVTPAVIARQPIEVPAAIPAPTMALLDQANVEGPRKRVRCIRCPRAEDRKTRDKCSSCQKPVCVVHSLTVCSPQCD